MVPKVAGKGRSFKGAGLYYLHDKKALTTERVAFTHTLNLPTDDPDKAIGWMAYTASRQAEIKRAAGGVAKGRKLRDPVYAYSLSWSPDERPTREQMIAAAQETLKRLGLAGHETVLIAHNDEPHPHIHVIVNRVNPSTGIAAPLSNDHLVLSEWAEAYERESGVIRCEQRVENNARRKREFVKDRASQSPAEFHRWRKARMEADFQRRQQEKADLSRRQDDERAGLAAFLKAEIQKHRLEQKEQQKPLWAALYKTQRTEKRNFEAAQRTVFGRLRYWLKNRDLDRWAGSQLDRQGMLARAFIIVTDSNQMRSALAARHEAERKKLSEKVRADTAASLKRVYRDHDRLRGRIGQEQSAARAALRDKHSRESQEAARRLAKGSDRAAFEFEKKAQPSDPIADGKPETIRPAFDRAATPKQPEAARQSGEEIGPEDAPEQPTEANSIEQGQAARIIREVRRRGLDESETDQGDESSRGDGGGQAFRAFRDAQERKRPPAQEPAKDSATGSKAFSAFRDAGRLKGAERDNSEAGRERSRPPPKPPMRDK